MGPRNGGVVGEGAEEPGRSERAPIASGGGMRRSEQASVSEEAVRRKGGGGSPRKLGMGRPRSPCGVRENLRQVGRAQGEVRTPKCQRKED
jgi:hypothetical protein